MRLTTLLSLVAILCILAACTSTSGKVGDSSRYEPVQWHRDPAKVILWRPMTGVVQDASILFQWQQDPDALEYELLLARNAGLDGAWSFKSENAWIKLSTFPLDGTEYFWAVRARGQGGWGEFSDVSSFRSGAYAPPPKPIPTPRIDLISPTNGEVVTANKLVLKWSDVPHSKYEVQISTSEDFGKSNQLWAKYNTVTPSLDRGGIVYYWRVRAIGSPTGTTDWSDTWTFQASRKKIPKAQLSYPVDSKIINASSDNLQFFWKKVKGAASYTLQVASNKRFEDAKEISVKSTSATMPLKKEKKYFWRVISYGSNAMSTSDVASFIFGCPSVEAIPLTGFEQFVTSDPEVKWRSSFELGDKYILQTANNKAFSNAKSISVKGSSHRVSIKGLKENDVVFWRVRNDHEACASSWSKQSCFMKVRREITVIPTNNICQ